MKMTPIELTEKYDQLLLRLKNLKWIFWMISFFSFGFLSYLSGQNFLQTHWLHFLLLSLATGCWIMLFIKLLSGLIFLFNFKKKPIVDNFHIIQKAFRKSRIALIQFSISTGFSLFCLYLFLCGQPNKDGTFPSPNLDDNIGVFAFSGFIAFMTFMLIVTILSQFLSINLFKDKSQHNSLSTLDDFQENSAHCEIPKSYSSEKSWQDWDHDPMNPASAEHQSTYRHWNNEN